MQHKLLFNSIFFNRNLIFCNHKQHNTILHRRFYILLELCKAKSLMKVIHHFLEDTLHRHTIIIIIIIIFFFVLINSFQPTNHVYLYMHFLVSLWDYQLDFGGRLTCIILFLLVFSVCWRFIIIKPVVGLFSFLALLGWSTWLSTTLSKLFICNQYFYLVSHKFFKWEKVVICLLFLLIIYSLTHHPLQILFINYYFLNKLKLFCTYIWQVTPNR